MPTNNSPNTIAAPNHLTTSQAARAIKSGDLTSTQLTQACLERTNAHDPEIGAWEYLDPQYALEQAKTADEHQARGDPLGPLHGVPVAIKDIIDTKDMPTQNGCPIFKDRRPEHDAPCVSALRAAGAVIIGKTVTTELALLTPAKTKNPLNSAHTPGGSSAGSAAAVADHMVPAALGTQTAGSILRPASYCGLFGFKPTLGLISRRGVLMQSHTLDTVGMLTRSLEDIALLTDCMAAHDPLDDVSYPRTKSNLTDALHTKPGTPPKFAFVKTPAWQDADPAINEPFQDLVTSLADHCEEIEIENFEDIIEWQRIIQIAENAAYYGPLLDKNPQHISKGLTERIIAGREESVTGYIDAIRAQRKARETVAAVLSKFDAILTPAAPGPAPKGFEITGSPIFNGSWTYLGSPAISLPLLTAENLPLGVQLVSTPRSDAHLLRTAHWLVKQITPQ